MPPSKLSEDDLCRVFAEKMVSSGDFKNWVLHRTKFAPCRFTARILRDEQIGARPKVLPERWWRHWFWRITELEKEHETDVLLLFTNKLDGLRFVLHVEMKLGSTLSRGQAASYAPRAMHVMTHEQRLAHEDFATLFVAPTATIRANEVDASLFDAVISIEEIAAFLPEFALATEQTRQAKATPILSDGLVSRTGGHFD